VPVNTKETSATIMKRLKFKSFPDDFLPANYKGLDLSVGPFEEISMYRELEGVNLLIDSRRIFFGSIQQAKFAFFALKAGKQEVRIPDEEDAKYALRQYRRYLSEIEAAIIEEAKELGAEGKEQDEVLRGCMESLLGDSGYDQD
jgi:hypothetical protein